MKRQDQRVAENGQAIQAESVNISTNVTNNTTGLSYFEVKDLLLTLFRENFYQMRGEAMATVEARVEEITIKYLEEMQKRSPENFASASDPAVQRALVTAQGEYACSGNQELGDVLVDMLADRTEATTGTLKAIVLSEALSTAPKLTRAQTDVLTAIVALRHITDNGLRNPDDFYAAIRKSIGSIATSAANDNISFQHMGYVGVGAISLNSWPIYSALSETYPAIFTHGFTRSEIPEELEQFIDSDLFVTAFRNEGSLQVSLGNNFIADQTITPGHRLFPHLNAIKDLLKSNLLSPDDVKMELTKNVPELMPLFNTWETTQMKHFELTSVGIAIGHANWRRFYELTPDLSLFFPDDAA